MLVQAKYELKFDIPDITPFVLMLRPRSGPNQWITWEEYKIVPQIPVTEYMDSYGNLCQRLIAPPGDFSIQTAVKVLIPDQINRAPGAAFVEVQNLPETVLGYLLPSRYCESECFLQMATEITENVIPGYDQVSAIENWIRDKVSYVPGSSDIPISAVDVNQKRSGVCRDLAHLGIALCRSLTIPARMVVGYCSELEPMDMHAWFEAFVGGCWYIFDASLTDEQKRGYVAIGYGRDAADVAVYNQFGPAVYPVSQQVSVSSVEGIVS